MIDQSPIDARRLIALQGGRNFRDLGGYRTQEGHTVKWGKIFRSGSMVGFTPADHEFLERLAIKTVCDLRTNHEREAEPNNWCRAANITYWARDYTEGFGELRKLMGSSLTTAADARAAMIEGYRRLPFQQAPAYQELFRRLAAGELPLVFNCSAGKDRAGVAAALILSALGVARETVLQDYLLTDRIVDFQTRFMEMAQKRKSTLAKQSPEIVAAVLGTHAAYLTAAIDALEARYGSMALYLQECLGVDAGALSEIKRQLLE